MKIEKKGDMDEEVRQRQLLTNLQDLIRFALLTFVTLEPKDFSKTSFSFS